MSRKTTRYLGLAVLLALASAGADEEVSGSGYGATSRPAVPNAPPPEYTEENNAHDVVEGARFDHVTDYELRQGASFDNKQRWRNTDYIHWDIHGATLQAEGQASDNDARQATIVSSEAWGAQVVVAEINDTEAEHGKIAAQNKISFDYSFLVSGSLGEASVQLDGTAIDIVGADHRFHANHQQGASYEKREREASGTKSKDYAKLDARFRNTPEGDNDEIGAEMGVSEEEYDELEISVTTRQPSAGGDNGSSPTVTIEDVVTGVPPMKKKYEVFSEGGVVLRARAGMTSDEGPQGATVHLKKFRVINSLRVWTSTTYPWIDPPWGEHFIPRTTTGHDEMVDYGDNPWWMPIWSDDMWGRTEVSEAHGLTGEAGALPGTLRVRLSRGAPHDAAFAVIVEPEGALEIEETLRIPEGRKFGSLPFRPRLGGTAHVFLHLLDENGAPTDTVLAADAVCRSTTASATPRLWAAVPGRSWAAGRGIAIRGRPGLDAGPLSIGRTGFAALETTATTVQVTVEDDAGVLTPLPPAITIPAGEVRATVPLVLTEEVGEATVHLRAGDEEIAVRVSSRAPTWRTVSIVRVPVGASARVPFFLGQADDEERTVGAATDDAAVATSSGEIVLAPGERAWRARVTGHAIGGTALRLASDDLPELAVAVEVVPATVTLDNGVLTIRDLDPTRAGALRLQAADGVRFAFTPPEGAGEFLEVEGQDTSAITLTFTPSPEMPASLSFPLAAEDDDPGSGSVEIEVVDERGEPSEAMRYLIATDA